MQSLQPRPIRIEPVKVSLFPRRKPQVFHHQFTRFHVRSPLSRISHLEAEPRVSRFRFFAFLCALLRQLSSDFRFPSDFELRISGFTRPPFAHSPLRIPHLRCTVHLSSTLSQGVPQAGTHPQRFFKKVINSLATPCLPCQTQFMKNPTPQYLSTYVWRL